MKAGATSHVDVMWHPMVINLFSENLKSNMGSVAHGAFLKLFHDPVQIERAGFLTRGKFL